MIKVTRKELESTIREVQKDYAKFGVEVSFGALAHVLQVRFEERISPPFVITEISQSKRFFNKITALAKSLFIKKKIAVITPELAGNRANGPNSQ